MINAKEHGGINLKNWNTRRAQIVVTYDCNMNCSFCINYKLGKKKKGFIKISDIVYFLQYLKYVEKLDEAIIVLLGGEPTLMPIEQIKEICNLAHYYGYKTETYTNGTLKENLLKLDGYIDYITISNYSKNLLPFDNMEYLNEFKYSTITISKLISKDRFPTFEEFDSYVDEVNLLPYNYDFTTMHNGTSNFNNYHPEWVDTKLMNIIKIQDVEGRIKGALYKDRLIKLSHAPFDIKEVVCSFKLFPNGNLSTTWKSDETEIDYKKEIQKILSK